MPPDPIAAWRGTSLSYKPASSLTERNFAAVRFRGGGTDLTVGVLDGARWEGRAIETRWGAPMVCNMPTEEVYTTPDRRRTDGVVHITRPINLTSGGQVEGLTLRFEQGRAVTVEATRGAEFVRAQMAIDDGASRLGEVALVDGSSPAGRPESSSVTA